MLALAEFVVHHDLITLVVFGILIFITGQIRQSVRVRNAANWPVAEGTIQSVRKVFITISSPMIPSHSIDVGDFSYKVDDDRYSGTLTISRSFSTGEAVPSGMINQKIDVRYNPRKPEQFSVPKQVVGGFLLDSYDESGTDDLPIDLNIDKI